MTAAGTAALVRLPAFARAEPDRDGRRVVELDRDPLGLSKEAMREIGYRTIDLLVEQLTDPDIPAMRRGRCACSCSRPPDSTSCSDTHRKSIAGSGPPPTGV